MNWIKGSAIAFALLAGPVVSPPAMAETPAVTTAAAGTAETASGDEASKRAKAIDCSKQADAKKLHGEARKKFRESCKRGK